MMAVLKDNKEAGAERAKSPFGRVPRLTANFSLLLLALACFAVTLSVTLIQNLSQANLHLAALFDSGQYLFCCRQVLEVLRNLDQIGDHATLVKTAERLGDSIMLNGPVLPLVGALFFLVINETPSLMDMRAPLVLQAILQAGSSVLLLLAARRMGFSKLWAAGVALFWGLYPSAVIGAGRFMTETLSVDVSLVFFLSLSMLVNLKDRSKFAMTCGAAFAAGLSAAVLLLLKPALAGAIVLAGATMSVPVLFSRLPIKRYLVAAMLFLAGAAIIAGPWIAYTKTATGEFYLTPQRMPTYNIAAGSNPETDGWGAIPETRLTTLFSEEDGSTAALFAVWQLDPKEAILRLARKWNRLWMYPWNDSRLPFLFIPAEQHVLWHQIIIALGLLGAISILSRDVNILKTTNHAGPAGSHYLGLAACLFVAAHALYLPFVTNARYWFTAMPFVFLIAAVALETLSRKSKRQMASAIVSIAAFIMALHLPDFVAFLFSSPDLKSQMGSYILIKLLLYALSAGAAYLALLPSPADGEQLTYRRALSLSAAFAFILCAVPAFADAFAPDATGEWQAPLRGDMTAVRKIRLPHLDQSPRWAALVFDGNENLDKAKFMVNGEELSSPPLSMIHTTGTLELPNNYRVFSAVLNKHATDLRQWRQVAVPLSLIRPGQENTLAVSGLGSSLPHFSIYGSSSPAKGHLLKVPSLHLISPTKLLNDPTNLDPRLTDAFPFRIQKGECRLTDRHSYSKLSHSSRAVDLSSMSGTQTGQFRLFLVIGVDGDEPSGKNDERGPKSADGERVRQSASGRLLAANKERHESGKGESVKLTQSEELRTYRRPYSLSLKVPDEYLKSPYLKVEVTGSTDKAPSDKAPLLISTEVRDGSLLGSTLPLETYPKYVTGDFRAVATAGTSALAKSGNTLWVRLSAVQGPVRVSSLAVRLAPESGYTFADGRALWF